MIDMNVNQMENVLFSSFNMPKYVCSFFKFCQMNVDKLAAVIFLVADIAG